MFNVFMGNSKEMLEQGISKNAIDDFSNKNHENNPLLSIISTLLKRKGGNEIAMKIPMGYKVIFAYERLDIVSNGNIVWRNQDKNAWERRTLDGWKIKYVDNSVVPVIRKYLENVYCIFDQQGKTEYGVYCGFIDSYEQAMAKAISLSKECNEKFLVCKVLAWQDWH